jgi:hypothetical protein
MALFQRKPPRRRGPSSNDPPPLGLVVGPRCIVIIDPLTNEVVFDGVKEMERVANAAIARGERNVTFEDDDEYDNGGFSKG